MKDELVNDLSKLINEFQDSMKAHLPAFEQGIDVLIDSKSTDTNLIENTLDTLLSLVDIGIGSELFIKLLEYYKTVDSEGAQFYWNEYDKDDEF